MKRRCLIVSIVVLLCAGGSVLWRYSGRLFHVGKVSDTYLKYKDVPGVDATFVKDFAINDSVCVDVTILKATDENGWAMLQKDYDIKPYTKEVLDILEKSGGVNKVDMRYIAKETNCTHRDSTLSYNDIVAISRDDYMVAVFSIDRKEQVKAVFRQQIKQITINTKEP